MPRRQEPPVGGGADRFDLGPQRSQRTSPQNAQHLGVAPLLGSGDAGHPFGSDSGGDEVAAHQPAVTGQPGQHVRGDPQAQPEPGGGFGGGERGAGARVAAEQLAQGIGYLFGEAGRDADRNRHPDPVAQAADIFDGHPPSAVGERNRQRAAGGE